MVVWWHQVRLGTEQSANHSESGCCSSFPRMRLPRNMGGANDIIHMARAALILPEKTLNIRSQAQAQGTKDRGNNSEQRERSRSRMEGMDSSALFAVRLHSNAKEGGRRLWIWGPRGHLEVTNRV